MTRARRHLPAAFAMLLAVLPMGGAVAQDTPDPEQLVETIAQIETMIVQIDAMIVDQDARLADLYEQRDAAEAGPRQASLDQLIDTLTLQLDKTEALQATLRSQADAFRAALFATEAVAAEADRPTTNGASEE
ncbi:hypothetical protein ACSSV8_003717 [Roseovarius sp. MBR-79]|jgi:hypothetical protein